MKYVRVDSVKRTIIGVLNIVLANAILSLYNVRILKNGILSSVDVLAPLYKHVSPPLNLITKHGKNLKFFKWFNNFLYIVNAKTFVNFKNVHLIKNGIQTFVYAFAKKYSNVNTPIPFLHRLVIVNVLQRLVPLVRFLMKKLVIVYVKTTKFAEEHKNGLGTNGKI